MAKARPISMKPVEGLPLVAIAALSFFLFGFMLRRRRRRGDPSDDDESPSLEQLRARRIRAMEARIARGFGSSEPDAARLTPLGVLLSMSSKINEIEDRMRGNLDEQERLEILHSLKTMQQEIEAMEFDESIRKQRKIQSSRLAALIQDLER